MYSGVAPIGTCESYTTRPTCKYVYKNYYSQTTKIMIDEKNYKYHEAILTFDHLLKGSRFTPLFIRTSAKSLLRVYAKQKENQ